ncbi:MAG: guanylate kinase [Tenericutes bacterium]|nr:guanylate kinase [Mycoplasmatota bacterium]
MSIIKQKEKGLLIVVSGPSGAGKDTIVNEVVKRKNINAWISISMTSRSPRGQEENGKEYFFVTREEFEENISKNNFLEYAEYNGNYYGTPKHKIEEYLNKGIDVILIIEIQGALQIKELIPEALFIFIMPPSMEELKKRLIARGTDSPDKIISRFKTAYQEINEVTKYNYVVVNDDLENAVDKVSAILLSEKCRVDRIEEVFLNSNEELLHEGLIDNKEFKD